MTGLQDMVYEWSKEIEGELNYSDYKQFKNDIEKLNTLDDVFNYYAHTRSWYFDRELMETLTWLLVDLARKGFRVNKKAGESR